MFIASAQKRDRRGRFVSGYEYVGGISADGFGGMPNPGLASGIVNTQSTKFGIGSG